MNLSSTRPSSPGTRPASGTPPAITSSAQGSARNALYRKFRLKANGASEAVLHAAAVKAGGKAAAEVVGTVRPHKGEAVIAFGWATAEALVDGLAPPKSRK